MIEQPSINDGLTTIQHLYQHTRMLLCCEYDVQSLGIQYTPVSTGQDIGAMMESSVQLL